MAERNTKVRLSAQVSEYVDGMREAAAATRAVGSEGENLAQIREAFNTLGRTAIVAGTAMAAGLGLAVSRFVEFDQAMSYVQSATHETAENLQILRDAAIDAGASTVFSATEAANAIEELSKAGVSTADIMAGGLKGSLDLAAAGGLGVADAAGIAATALKVFKLDGSEMSHVADLLAAGAGKAMGDVTDLSAALAQGGQVAAATGLSIEETTATLAAFASQGLMGSDAGTSFKTMLQRLTPQSVEAKEKMEELGISAYDANGEFIGMAEFAGNLQGALKDLTPEQRNAALSVMFGSDAVRAANVLLTEGEKGIRDWTTAVDDQGYAAETAAMRLDNLAGDWEAFTGALDSGMIVMGEAADGPARFFVQLLTDMVDGFNAMPAGGQQAVFWVGAVGAAAFLSGGVFLAAVPKVAAYKVAIETLGSTAQKTSRLVGTALAAGAIVGGAAVATMALGTFVRQLEGTDRKIEESIAQSMNLGDALTHMDEVWQGFDLGSGFEGLVALQENGWSRLSGIWDQAMRDGIGLQSGLSELDSQLGPLAEANLPAARKEFQRWAEATDGSKEQLLALLDGMPTFRAALQDTAKASGGLATDQELVALAMETTEGATDKATAATEELAVVAEEAAADLDELKDALAGVAATAMDMGGSVDDALSSINSLSKAAETEGASLWGVDDASISLRDSMRDVEQSHRDAAQAIIDNGGTYDQAIAQWSLGREAVIAQREAMGESRDEAVLWADTNLGSAAEVQFAMANVATAVNSIPTAPVINITMLGHAEAYDHLMSLQSALRSVTGDQTIRVATGGGGQGGQVAGNYQGGFYEAGVKQFYQGGFPSDIYKGVQGGIHKFAESEMGVPWEAYISGRPADRDRNIGTWQRAGDMLGVTGGGGRQGAQITLTQHVAAPPGSTAKQTADLAFSKFDLAIGDNL